MGGRSMTKNLVPLRHEGRLGERIVPPERDTAGVSTCNANKSFKSLSGMSSSVGGRKMEKSKSQGRRLNPISRATERTTGGDIINETADENKETLK